MARKGIKAAADEIIIYAVYNKEDLPVIVGTSQEIAVYLGVTKNYVHKLVCQADRYKTHCKNSNYTVYRIGTEKIKEKRCSVCGKVKPTKQFVTRKNGKGKKIYCTYCIECKSEYFNRMPSRIKKKEKTNG